MTKLLASQHQIAKLYDIIALSETFLNERSTHNLIIEGYHPIIQKDRSTQVASGIATYISQNCICKWRADLELPNTLCLWLEIRLNNNEFLLAICCRTAAGMDF